MDKKNLKKEFKKKCKKEKATSYRFSLYSGIISVVGAIIVIAAFIFSSMTPIAFADEIYMYIIGAIVCLFGVIFDLIGEYMFSKEFKKYVASKNME